MPNPKVPTAIRKLTGNPQHRPMPTNEPQPRRGRPSMPAHLDKEAKAEWRRVVPELARIGLLTVIDRSALAAYCAAWSRYVDADRHIQEEGMVLETDKGPVTNPYTNAQIKLAGTIRMYAQEFGLTPSARSRMQLPGEREPDAFDREYGG